MPRQCSGTEEQVLFDRHLGDERKLLKHRRHALRAGIVDGVERDDLAVAFDMPGAGCVRAGQHGDKRGLARTVLAKEHVYFTRTQVEIDRVEGTHTGVILGQAPSGKKGCARRHAWITPPGRPA